MWIISFEKPRVEHCMLLVLSRLIPNGIKNSMRFTQLSGCEDSATELNRLHYIYIGDLESASFKSPGSYVQKTVLRNLYTL